MSFSQHSKERRTPESPPNYLSISCETRTKCCNFKDAVKGIISPREALKSTSIRHALVLELLRGEHLPDGGQIILLSSNYTYSSRQLSWVCQILRNLVSSGHTYLDSDTLNSFLSQPQGRLKTKGNQPSI